MADDAKRAEDQEKLQDEAEQEERIRQEAKDESFFTASAREMQREMHDKGPVESMRDDLKATKEAVKEWIEDDADTAADDQPAGEADAPEETHTDEMDKPRPLPGDQPSEK